MSGSSTKKSNVDSATVQKILRTVPYENGFHFSTNMGKNSGETAINLFSFSEELRTTEPSSVRFHFQRRDFQNWIEQILGDKNLSSAIDKINSNLPDQKLKETLIKTVQARFEELQTLFNMEKPMGPPGEELKKFKFEELKQYCGQEGKPVYIVFDGKVYDVSSSSSWSGGTHKAIHQAGKDLTQDLMSAPHGDEVFGKIKQVGVLVE